MPEIRRSDTIDISRDEAYLGAYAKAREVFDEEEKIEEEASQLFGIAVEDIEIGAVPRKVSEWIENRYRESGWRFIK